MVDPAQSFHPVRRIVLDRRVCRRGRRARGATRLGHSRVVPELWSTLRTISVGHILVAVIALTIKTFLTAFAWYTILRYAYPGEVRLRHIYAAYAMCVALNAVLPANWGRSSCSSCSPR